MNSEKFEAWFIKILSLIPQNSVVVLDNAPYHSRVLEKWPTSAWRKEQIKEFLKKKNKFCSVTKRHNGDWPE
jgi:predicted O-methyltransferase YrrM